MITTSVQYSDTTSGREESPAVGTTESPREPEVIYIQVQTARAAGLDGQNTASLPQPASQPATMNLQAKGVEKQRPAAEGLPLDSIRRWWGINE